MNKPQFEEIIVIGIGKVALTCAMKAKDVFDSVSFLESGSNGITPPPYTTSQRHWLSVDG